MKSKFPLQSCSLKLEQFV